MKGGFSLFSSKIRFVFFPRTHVTRRHVVSVLSPIVLQVWRLGFIIKMSSTSFHLRTDKFSMRFQFLLNYWVSLIFCVITCLCVPNVFLLKVIFLRDDRSHFNNLILFLLFLDSLFPNIS